MKLTNLHACAIVIFYYLLGCKNNQMELADFTSDGCSLFADGTFENPELWKECCIRHDIAYWRGGTEKEREKADLVFKSCIEKRLEMQS